MRRGVWPWLIVVLAMTACTEEPAPAPQPGVSPREVAPEGTPPPVGTPERADWDLARILERVQPGDVERAREVVEALAAFRERHRDRPAELRALAAEVSIATENGLLDEALEAHLRAAELFPDPQAAGALMEAAGILAGQGRYEESLDLLDRIEKELPAYAGGVTALRVRDYLGEGRMDDAIATLREEIRLRGDRTAGRDARLELGRVLLEHGDVAGAREQLVALWPRHRGLPVGQLAGLRLAWLEEREGRPDAAREILRRIATIGIPEYAEEARGRRAVLDRLGEPAPTLDGPTLGGGPLPDLAGRTAVLVVWDPRVAGGVALFSSWASALAGRDEVALLGVVPEEVRDEAVRAMSEAKIEAPCVAAPAEALASLGGAGAPRAVVVDAEGKIVASTWPSARAEDLPR